jgi:predicted nucleotidyltransferase
MKTFSEQIRELRAKQGDPLRLVAAYLDIDQSILSKIEHGHRRASREQVMRLAEYFKVDGTELIKVWLSDNIAYTLENEEHAMEVLKVAEQKVAYQLFKKSDKKLILKKIRALLKQSGKIEKAWIYGSFARGDDGPGSDIDIAVETGKEFSYFDLAEVQYCLEKEINRKVDIGFLDSFKPRILESVKADLKLVYES